MIWIPYGDENPCRRRPVVHWAVWLACLGGSIATFALGWARWPQAFPIAFNLVLLVILGDNVEDRLGRIGYAIFVLAAAGVGAVAAFRFAGGARGLHVAVHAVCAAAIGAYVVWFPRAWIKGAFLAGRRRSPDLWREVPVPAWLLVGLWAAANAVAAAILGVTPTTAAVGATFLAGAIFAAVWAAVMPAPAVPQRAVVEAAAPAKAARVRRGGHEVAGPPGQEGHFLEGRGEAVALPVLGRAADAGAWALIRTDDRLHEIPRVGRIVASYTREPLAEATLRIRRTRGVLARGVAEDVAQTMARELSEAGIECEVIPDGPDQALPAAVEMLSAAVDEKGFRLDLADGTEVEAPWVQIFLVLGASLPMAGLLPELAPEQEPIVEVYNARPYLRMRGVRRRTRFEPEGIRGFCREMLARRRVTPVNPGVSVIAHGGRFGYLEFTRAVDFDGYAWWMAQIVRRPAAPAGHYLE